MEPTASTAKTALCECLVNGCLFGGGEYDIPAIDSGEPWPTCQECGENVYVMEVVDGSDGSW